MREHLRAATFGRSLIDFRLCDFVPATLAQADTPARKPWRSDQGRPHKKIGRPTPDTPGPPPAMPGPGPPPRRPQKPQTGAPAGGYASPPAPGTAHRGPRGTPYAHASETETARNAAGRPQDERKIKPGEITPGKRKPSTEPPQRRHAKRNGGRRHGSKTPQQGRTPARAKRNPPEALPPAGLNYLSRALSTAPKKIMTYTISTAHHLRNIPDNNAGPRRTT